MCLNEYVRCESRRCPRRNSQNCLSQTRHNHQTLTEVNWNRIPVRQSVHHQFQCLSHKKCPIQTLAPSRACHHQIQSLCEGSVKPKIDASQNRYKCSEGHCDDEDQKSQESTRSNDLKPSHHDQDLVSMLSHDGMIALRALDARRPLSRRAH